MPEETKEIGVHRQEPIEKVRGGKEPKVGEGDILSVHPEKEIGVRGIGDFLERLRRGEFLPRKPKRARGIDELEKGFKRYLAEVEATERPIQPAQFQKIEEFFHETFEIKTNARLSKEKREKADCLYREAVARVRLHDFWHKYWYGPAGIGKTIEQVKELSREMLINHFADLWSITDERGEKPVVEAMKEQKGFIDEKELTDWDNPYKRIGHHLRRISLRSMYYDAYIQAERQGKALTVEEGKVKIGDRTIWDAGEGKSFEFALYRTFFTTAQMRAQRKPGWELLLERHPITDKVIEDHGEMGYVFDMWADPDKWRLYSKNYENLGLRNQLALLSRVSDEELREARIDPAYLGGFRLVEVSKKDLELAGKLMAKKVAGEMMTDEEKKRLEKFRELSVQLDRETIGPMWSLVEEKLVESRKKLSEEEERALEEEERALKERLKPLDALQMVMMLNLINKERGFDIDQVDFDLGAIYSDPRRYWRYIEGDPATDLQANDLLTNLLVKAKYMETTEQMLEVFLRSPSFETAAEFFFGEKAGDAYGHICAELAFKREKQKDWILREATRKFINSKAVQITYAMKFIREKEAIIDEIKLQPAGGMFRKKLKDLYGIDFIDSRLTQQGATLEQILDVLDKVHGKETLIAVYRRLKREGWSKEEVEYIISVLEKGKGADDFEKEQFKRRFGFRTYLEFNDNIIEQPALNAAGIKTGPGRTKGKDELIWLWKAKHGQLKGNKGIYIKSLKQDLHPEDGEKEAGPREEGGSWIEMYNLWEKEDEKIGYVDREGVYWRRIVDEDRMQHTLWEVEEYVYDRNATLLDIKLRELSPDEARNPERWLEPVERRNIIDEKEDVDEIDSKRAEELMRKHGCQDRDIGLWHIKNILLGNFGPLETAVRGVPFVGDVVRTFARANMIGGLTGVYTGARVAVALTSAGFGLPAGAGLLVGLLAIPVESSLIRWLVSQRAWFGKRDFKVFKLPVFYLHRAPKGPPVE